MARSTDTKRTAAKRKMPARRSPARRGTAAAAARPHRPEQQAAPAGRNGVAATESAGAPTPEAVGERVAAPKPESAATAAPTAVNGENAEPAPRPDERLAVQPEPAPPARTEEVPSAPEAAAQAASAPPADAASALEPGRAAVAEASATAGALAPRWSLVEGAIGMHGQAVAFACRQTEFGLVTGRAMLASRSLPEIVSLQSAFVGRSVENALAHTLELTRLSAAILREGLRSASER